MVEEEFGDLKIFLRPPKAHCGRWVIDVPAMSPSVHVHYIMINILEKTTKNRAQAILSNIMKSTQCC